MQYHEFEPHPSLARYILNYWAFAAGDFEDAPYMHHVMPDGCVSLVYKLPSSSTSDWIGLAGPRLKEIRVPVMPGAQWWGVRFWPDALQSILHVAPLSLLKATPSSSPAFVKCLHTRLATCKTFHDAGSVLDTAFMNLLPRCTPLDKVVRRGIECIVAMQGLEPITKLAGDLGLSERQFQRRFRTAVGLTPKQFARIRRFRSSIGNVLRQMPDTWGRVAAENGYADQAHMTREFSTLVGLPPTSFQKRVSVIEHHNVSP